MAPKKKIRNRTQSSAPEVVPIYDMLADRQLDQPVRQIMKKLQFLSENSHHHAIEDSFAKLLMETCGLSRWVSGINWRQDYRRDLEELIQHAPDEFNSRRSKGNEQQNTDFFLLNLKSKFHSEFKQRLQQLIRAVFTDELAVIFETDAMKMMFEVLRQISKCKLRNIRASSIQIAAIVTHASNLCYEQLIESRRSKRAAKILTVIEEGYIDSIFRPRIKDIDSTIRQKAFNVIEATIKQLELELMSKQKLTDIFQPALNDHSPKVTELALTALRHLLEVRDLKPATVTNMCDFAIQSFPIFEELALLPTNSGCLAMKCLLSANRLKNNLQILKPKTISKIFETHGYEQHQEGLKIAVQLFYRSLVDYNDEEQLLKHSQTIMIEIAHLLSTISSQKLIRTILKEFMRSQQNLFDFENIFTLLISEYYRESEIEIQFQRQEITILLYMALQLNEKVSRLCEQKKGDEWVDSQVKNYNKNLLQSSKQIFYDRLTNSQNYENSHLYIRLFSHLFLDHISQFRGEMSFVTDQVLVILRDEKFIVMGNEEVTKMNDIVKQCVAVFHHFNQQTDASDILLQAINLHQMESRTTLDPIDIIKFTNISMYYPAPFQQQQFLQGCIHLMESDNEESIQLLMLNFMLHAHKNMLKELFMAPTSAAYHHYTVFRDAFLEVVITMLNHSRNKMVRLGAFSALTQTLRYISNNKLALPGTLYYEVPDRHLSVLLDYVSCNFMTEFELLAEIIPETQNQLGSHLNTEEVKLSTMINNIGLNGDQVREKILEDIFLLFQDCHKIAIKVIGFILKMQLFSINTIAIQQSLTASSVNLSVGTARNANEIFNGKLKNFIVSLIKNQCQEEYSNKFVFWRFFGELAKQAKLLDLRTHRPLDSERAPDHTITEQVIDDLLNSYFKFKQRANTHASKILSDKLMLFIADYSDKTVTSYLCYSSVPVHERKSEDLHKIHSSISVIRQILGKVRRRYPKEVLHRLTIFFSNKIERLPEDKQLNSLQQYLTKISHTNSNKNSRRGSRNTQANRPTDSSGDEEDSEGHEQESQDAQSESQNEMALINKGAASKLQQKQKNKITNRVETRNRTKKKMG